MAKKGNTIWLAAMLGVSTTNANNPAMSAKMTRKLERKPDDAEQSKRFIDAARKAEADETEKGADRAFKKIVPSKRKASQRR